MHPNPFLSFMHYEYRQCPTARYRRVCLGSDTLLVIILSFCYPDYPWSAWLSLLQRKATKRARYRAKSRFTDMVVQSCAKYQLSGVHKSWAESAPVSLSTWARACTGRRCCAPEPVHDCHRMSRGRARQSLARHHPRRHFWKSDFRPPPYPRQQNVA